MTLPARGRTGVALREPLPWHDLEQVVRAAEEAGHEVVFVPEVAGREAFATLSALAGRTATVRLGTGVVTTSSRSPHISAMAAATVQDVSNGRMILGIGAGRSVSIDRVREYVHAVREFRPEFDVTGGQVPVWLGALGDRMIELAGEVADGVLLNWCLPERVAQAKRLVTRGAERSGRDPTSVVIAVYVRACLGVEEPAAVAALAEATGRYAAIPQYLRQLELMGLGGEGALAAEAHRKGRPDRVPERLVEALTVWGGRSQALVRFEEFRAADADLVVCYPVPALDGYSSVLGTVLASAPAGSVLG